MIQEDATKEAFGYYPNDLKSQSNKPIIATCELCGAFRITTKNAYRTLCNSCAKKGNQYTFGYKHTEETKAKISAAQKGKKHTEETKANMSAAQKGENHPMFNKHRSEATKALMSAATKGKKHTEETKAKISAAQKGKKHTEETKANMSAAKKGKFGEQSSAWKGGKKLSNARSRAKRKRQLGYTLLMPLRDDDAGHHVTNEYVIGIPAKVHDSIGGSRKKHRTRVLGWLKANDKKKYNLVIAVLAKMS